MGNSYGKLCHCRDPSTVGMPRPTLEFPLTWAPPERWDCRTTELGMTYGVTPDRTVKSESKTNDYCTSFFGVDISI